MNPYELYKSIQEYVRKEIDVSAQRSGASSQYSVSYIPIHTHNNIDSPPVAVTSLAGIDNHSAINTIVLTPAQIKALHTTPIQLVPQQGLRTVIIVDGITARIVYSGTAYTGANSLEFRYTDGSGTKVTADIPNTFINSASSAFYQAPAVTSAFAPIPGGSGNNGRIVVSVPTANPATGNSAITIAVKYHLVAFAS